MRYSEEFASKWLGAGDLAGRETMVTISDIAKEEMHDKQTGKMVTKPVVYFAELERGMVLNKTNAKFLFNLTGTDDMGKWPGTRAVLFAGQTPMGPGLMLRAPKSKPTAKPRTMSAKTETPSFGDDPEPPAHDSVPEAPDDDEAPF